MPFGLKFYSQIHFKDCRGAAHHIIIFYLNNLSFTVPFTCQQKDSFWHIYNCSGSKETNGNKFYFGYGGGNVLDLIEFQSTLAYGHNMCMALIQYVYTFFTQSTKEQYVNPNLIQLQSNFFQLARSNKKMFNLTKLFIQLKMLDMHGCVRHSDVFGFTCICMQLAYVRLTTPNTSVLESVCLNICFSQVVSILLLFQYSFCFIMRPSCSCLKTLTL